MSLLLEGRIPADGDCRWYDVESIHLCTIRDFVDMCDELELEIEQALSLSSSGSSRQLNSIGVRANLRGEEAVFLLSRK